MNNLYIVDKSLYCIELEILLKVLLPFLVVIFSKTEIYICSLGVFVSRCWILGRPSFFCLIFFCKLIIISDWLAITFAFNDLHSVILLKFLIYHCGCSNSEGKLVTLSWPVKLLFKYLIALPACLINFIIVWVSWLYFSTFLLTFENIQQIKNNEYVA